MASANVRDNSMDDGRNGIVAALLEGTENRHEDCWGVRTPLTAVAVAVLAKDHRGPDGPFGSVVLEGNVGLIQEGVQVVLMSPQPLDQPPRVRVFPGA